MFGQLAASGTGIASASSGVASSGGAPPGGGITGLGENGYCSDVTDLTCFTGNVTDGPANLPQSGMYTGMDGTPANGPVVTVNYGTNATAAVQTALNNAVCGERIILPALNGGVQAVFGPNITFPNHSCNANQWIWVMTDQLNNVNFPAEHVRITPCAVNVSSLVDYPGYSCPSPAILMPQFQAGAGGGISAQAIIGAASSNYYRIIGVEISTVSGAINDLSLVDLSNGVDHYIFDRVYLHGEASNCSQTNGVYSCSSADIKNGIQVDNSTNVALINSWGSDFLCPQGSCTDAHVLSGGNGSAASHGFKLWNNLLAAAGESWIFGGNGNFPGTTTTPTDIEIRGNHSMKPVSWELCTNCSGAHPEPKNLGEFKNAIRVLVEGNEFENSWTGWLTDQSGYATLLTPKNQSNTSFVNVTSDGTGTTLTANGGATFPSTVTSASCATPNHCQIKLNGIFTQVQTNPNSTTVTVSPAVTANFTGSALVCQPGLNPTAIDTDITYRFNEFRNSVNGIQFAAVPSDCGDISLGIHNVSLHDNLFNGMNALLADNVGSNNKSTCIQTTNDQANNKNIYNYSIQHNTCAIALNTPGAFSSSGFDVTLDETNTTTNGADGAYFSNRVVKNNIGPAGGITNYKLGVIYPGGLSAGLAQQSCIPPVTGGTCTWTYTRNVLGIGLWTSQTNNTPFPATNQTCGGANTCFPSGTAAFTGNFTAYNGPLGQNGYLGTYTLANTSVYKGAGDDGLDIGVSDWTTFNNKTSGVRHAITYTAPSITASATFPTGVVNTNYSANISTVQASDFIWLSVLSGSLPAGLTLQQCSGVWCLKGTPTAAGSYSFTLQGIDAAQQYTSKAFTMTVNGAPGNSNWVLVSTPAGATNINHFAVDSSNNWYLSDATSGFWKSTNQGSTWTQINSAVMSNTHGRTIQWDSVSGDLIAAIYNPNYPTAGPVHFYLSTNGGTTWAQISEPTNYTNSFGPALSGCVISAGTNKVTLCGGFYGPAGDTGMYSTNDNFQSTALVTEPGNSTIYSWQYNPNNATFYMGTETQGLWSSTDGHTFAAISPGSSTIRVGNILGITYDASNIPIFTAQGGIWKCNSSTSCSSPTNVLANGNTSAGNGIYKDSNGSIYEGHEKDTANPITIYRSLDNGTTWQEWDTGIPAQSLDASEFLENPNDGKIYAVIQNDSTNAGSIYSSTK